MKKIFLIGLVFFIQFSTAVLAATPEELALSLVEKYGFGGNLKNISYQAASQTQTYKMMVSKIGEQKTQSLVKNEVDKLIPKHQKEWNKNLAASYAQVLNAEKLQSLLDAGPSSKYADDLKAKQGEIGNIMQSKSSGLLNELLTKATDSAFKKSNLKK